MTARQTDEWIAGEGNQGDLYTAVAARNWAGMVGGTRRLLDNEAVYMRECVASDQFLATSALNYRLACDIQPTAVISMSRTLSLTHRNARTCIHAQTLTHTQTRTQAPVKHDKCPHAHA